MPPRDVPRKPGAPVDTPALHLGLELIMTTSRRIRLRDPGPALRLPSVSAAARRQVRPSEQYVLTALFGWLRRADHVRAGVLVILHRHISFRRVAPRGVLRRAAVPAVPVRDAQQLFRAAEAAVPQHLVGTGAVPGPGLILSIDRLSHHELSVAEADPERKHTRPPGMRKRLLWADRILHPIHLIIYYEYYEGRLWPCRSPMAPTPPERRSFT